MLAKSLCTNLARRLTLLVPLALAFGLTSSQPLAAAEEAGCGWACIREFGLIHVHDGEVHYYAGCVQQGNTIYCYYGVLLS